MNLFIKNNKNFRNFRKFTKKLCENTCQNSFFVLEFCKRHNQERYIMKRDRIEEIAELLDKRGKLSLDQLDDFFPNVSQMTLRRDLFQLEQRI